MRFNELDLVRNCVITIAPQARAEFEDALRTHFPTLPVQLVEGGKERQDSVRNGLAALEPATTIVIIHDAARPFVSVESVRVSVDAAAKFGAATVAIPSIDTILVSDADANLLDTPDRKTLWACQTPQTFRVDVLRHAHEKALCAGFTGTDDASLVRRAGGKVKLVMGSPLNFKVTTPQDLALARCVIEGGLA
jgi:2-C-methyl-D-erythritol 4-phosphate cytidylyltransferase